MKLQPGKFYRTAYGKKVGPVRIADSVTTNEWALWKSENGCIYEVVGLPREEAMDTKFLVEWTDTPKRWGDMTPEEKGALLLAHHEGKVIETFANRQWTWCTPTWSDHCVYRIRPQRERETVEMYGEQCVESGHWGFDNISGFADYRITFDLINGIPDTTSIRMEEI